MNLNQVLIQLLFPISLLVDITLFDQFYNELPWLNEFGQELRGSEREVYIILEGKNIFGENIIRDTITTSRVVNFSNLLPGNYDISYNKEGYIAPSNSINLKYEKGNYYVNNYRYSYSPDYRLCFVKMAQISTLTPGQLQLHEQTSQDIYIQTNFSSEGTPYFRLFINKGLQVSRNNYLSTFGYFANYPVYQLPVARLTALGLQKGDTVSIIGYGDNYVTDEFSKIKWFPCLTQESTNIFTVVLK